MPNDHDDSNESRRVFRSRISAVTASSGSSPAFARGHDAREISPEKLALQEAGIKEVLAQLGRDKRSMMGLARATGRLKDEFHCTNRKVAEVLSLKESELTYYKTLNRLVPEVQALVEQLGLWNAYQISYARRELQYELAKQLVNNEVSARAVQARVRLPTVRDPSLPMRTSD